MFVSSLSWECRDIVILFLSGVNVRFLCVVGFAGGGTPGHLILGGGVFQKAWKKKYFNHFWSYRQEIVCRYSSVIALWHILQVFEEKKLGGQVWKKKKIWQFWSFFEIYKILKIRDNSFVAILILRHCIPIRQLVVACKLHPWRWFP